jgi:hypothetical protein
MRGFVRTETHVTLDLERPSAKSPVVSGLHLKHSRIWETRARDRVRYTSGVGRSLPQPFLRKRSARVPDQERRRKCFW